MERGKYIMEEKYVILLKQVCDEAEKSRKAITDATSATSIVTDMVSTCQIMRNIIKDFFSDNDGEGERIRMVYQKTSNYASTYPKIKLIDMNWVNHQYNEYIDGMKVFINTKLQSIDQCSPEEETDRIREFIEKDRNFIASLFEGVNKKDTEPSELKDALGNLEVLIDFLPELNSKVEYASVIKRDIEDVGEADHPVGIELIRLYALSTIHFSKNLILVTFDSFRKIIDTMNQKRFNIPSAASSEKQVLQLF